MLSQHSPFDSLQVQLINSLAAMEHAVPEPCYTCRNRRIQCDQSGIPCTKCEKAGLECFDKRPLRWVKGVAIRGKMQGRSYERRAGASTAKSELAVSRPGNRQAQAVKMVHCENQDLFQGPMSIIPLALQDPAISNLDRVSKYYIDYYNDRICKLFIVYDSDRNPFRSLISLGLKDPVLLKAILALAARHNANTGHSFYQHDEPKSPIFIHANRDAFLFKHQAMEALSRALSRSTVDIQDTKVAGIFLLIFLDLLESGSDGWNFHLEGAKSLIASHRLLPVAQPGINQGAGQTINEIRDFITKQIHLIETLGATFLRPKLLSQFTSAQDLKLQETIEKSFLGCPEYLLMAIQSLSAQRDRIAESVPLDDTATRSHIQDVTTKIASIQCFDCESWVSSLYSPQPSAQKTSNLVMLSQSYKLGALIYGRRVSDALCEKVTQQDELVAELLGLIDALRGDQALFKCVLWPMIVAGLECRQQAQREFLTGCLEEFWVATNCLNVINAAKILQGYWLQDSFEGASSGWIFDIGRLGRDWLLI